MNRPYGNIALRLAPALLGLDVDAYENKLGAATLALAMGTWGDLPSTVRSSARRDGISGIYLYRVPAGLRWMNHIPANLVSGVTGNIDLIHWGLRYAVVPPSVHPSRMVYRWFDEEGMRLDLPMLDEIPDLPAPWVEALARSVEAAPRQRSRATGSGCSVPAASASVEVSLLGATDRLRHAAIGERNECLLLAAMHLGGDPWMDRDLAEPALIAAAVTAGLSRREAVATFASGWRHGRGE